MPEARKLRATLASERGVSGYSVDGFNVNFADPIAIQTAGAKIAFRPVGEATLLSAAHTWPFDFQKCPANPAL